MTSRRAEDFQTVARDILLVHSSDLHVDDDRIAALHGGDGTAGLSGVLASARAFGADIVLLAGDTFDNHMVTAATIDRAGRLLADAGLPVVILPGNHDPAIPDSIYFRGGFGQIPNLSILGITHDRALGFAVLELEIWGNAHRDYMDMVPLRDPPLRAARRRPRRRGRSGRAADRGRPARPAGPGSAPGSSPPPRAIRRSSRTDRRCRARKLRGRAGAGSARCEAARVCPAGAADRKTGG